MTNRKLAVSRTEAISNHNGFRLNLLWLILLSTVIGPRYARAQYTLPHFAAGGGFITGFYVFNMGSQPANYSISFHDDSGNPVALSFSGLGTRTSVSDTLPGNGSKYYEADSPSGDLLAGSGAITADPTISIQALFRRQGSGSDFSEAAVAAGLPANEFRIPFDATVFAANGSQINRVRLL